MHSTNNAFCMNFLRPANILQTFFFACDIREFTHLSMCGGIISFSSIITKRRQALLPHYSTYFPCFFISLSLCQLPSLHYSIHILNSLGDSQGSNWNASRENKKKKRRWQQSERERCGGRQWCTILAPHCCISLPCFLFSVSLPSSLLQFLTSPSLFGLQHSWLIKIQLTDVWLM